MAHLVLSALGALQVSVDGEPVKSFRSAKTRALLVYLILESNRAHTRDALAGLLWPDEPNQTARNNLRQTLTMLRKSIGNSEDTPSPYLDITRNTIQFNSDSDHFVDVVAFTKFIDTCAVHQHRHSETCRICAENRRQAVELYRGDFLDQFYLSDSDSFEEWALLKRERLRELALDALCQLAEFHTRTGNYKQALAFALRQLEIDPWREEAHRQAMRALALDGRLATALDQYENCRRALAEEMHAEPAQETIELYEVIKEQADHPSENNVSSPLLFRAPICNLPSTVTPLLGRTAERVELNRLLSDPGCRLVSIVGPGGVGKTRLAIAAADEQKIEFKDGVFFVSLAALDSVNLLAPTILSALGVASRGQQNPSQQLVNYLRERQVLLVLDNFEHLLEGTDLLVELLRRAPHTALLVTSRERLNLQGEWVLDLQGLEIPNEETTEDVERYSAVQLFLQSAKRSRAASSFSNEDKSIIVRICRMVEGIPLAIELAGAWVRTLSCREIADEIEKSFAFLTTSLRDVPQRHRSMRAVFEHSWDLLDDAERSALRRLSVFHGGFQRETAEQVAGATLDLLAALVDKSLVRLPIPEWYDLHELVRQFAYDELVKAQESEETRHRHAQYYLDLAETAASNLDGLEQAKWLQQLEAENANMRAAFAWSVEGKPERVEMALRLCGALGRTWDMRGYVSEGRHWLELALQLAEAKINKVDAIPAAVRIKALTAAGGLASVQGDHLVARSFHQQALKLCQKTGDKVALGTCFMNLGNVANHLGEYAEGRAFHEQALALFRELGDKARIARTLLNMGFAAHTEGDYALARMRYEESLALRRELGDQYGIALVLSNLSGLLSQGGEIAKAHVMVEESLSIRRSLGDQYGIANCLLELAALAHAEHNAVQAHDLLQQALTLLQKLGNTERVVACFELFAEIEVSLGKVEQGIQLWGAADAIRQTLGTPLPLGQRLHYEETIAQVRTKCGVSAFERAWEQGKTMTTEEAIACAVSKTE